MCQTDSCTQSQRVESDDGRLGNDARLVRGVKDNDTLFVAHVFVVAVKGTVEDSDSMPFPEYGPTIMPASSW